jgi:hypothetical protein
MGSEPFCSPGKPNAAWYEDAEPFACTSPKLPDLECALASLEPDADSPVPICSGRRSLGFGRCSYGVLFVPMGVTRLSVGGPGLRGCGAFNVGMPSLAPFVTGLALGDGGIERPSRGGPLPPGRAPGIGGRRRGAGDDMFCCSRGEGPLLIGCIYDMFLSQEDSATQL